MRLLSCALSLLLLFAALAIPAVCQDHCSHPRIITVSGTADIKVQPDQVTLDLEIESHDKDLSAKANNDKSVKSFSVSLTTLVWTRRTSGPALYPPNPNIPPTRSPSSSTTKRKPPASRERIIRNTTPCSRMPSKRA